MLLNLLKSILPSKLKTIILNFKNNYFDGFALKSYSQEGEDMILRRHFENYKKGFFIDVGAHHPKRFSNTYYFYKKGWNGINIDAMPGSMKLFNKFRPNDINLEKAVSDKKQFLKYYSFNEPALNGFSKELSEQRNEQENYQVEFTKEICTFSLEEILDENLPPNQIIDFLSIDVEGLDFRVLKSNNFKKYRPEIILVEILEFEFNKIEHSEIFKFLKLNEYSIFSKTINTVIFRDNEVC